MSFEPLDELLKPVFAAAAAAIAERPEVDKLELGMMAPGLLAFAAGGGAAWVVYAQGGGKSERAFAKSFPRLYQLMIDKWRIDELYDATVVGMVDALADIFTMADKWIIDGILARLSAGVVGLAGTVLRALQSGRVQAYSASMVVGLAGIGWFLVRPHTAVTIDEKLLKTTGQVTLTASPGLGYHYHWEVKDAAPKPAEHDVRPTPNPAPSEGLEYTVTLGVGESRDVVLEVRSAFDGRTREVFPLNRPAAPGGPRPAATMGAPGPNSVPAQGGQR